MFVVYILGRYSFVHLFDITWSRYIPSMYPVSFSHFLYIAIMSVRTQCVSSSAQQVLVSKTYMVEVRHTCFISKDAGEKKVIPLPISWDVVAPWTVFKSLHSSPTLGVCDLSHLQGVMFFDYRYFANVKSDIQRRHIYI